MEDTVSNLPIQLFSVANTTGELIPLTFRWEDRFHSVRLIRIARVLSHREAASCGIPHIIYICETRPEEGRSRIIELRYYILTHKWTLFRVLG